MRVQLWAALSLTLLLTACDNSEPSAPPRSIAVRSEAQNSLHRLNELNLKIALRRAIYDSGKACNTITQAGYVQEYGNLSMWTASCRSGRSFAIFVGPDGSAQVRDCREMETLRLPACTIRRRAGTQSG
jgi:hypothetical protein